MRKNIANIMKLVMLILTIGICQSPVFAEDSNIIPGVEYELQKGADYKLPEGEVTTRVPDRFFIDGDIESINEENGVTTYAVKSGNLSIQLNSDNGCYVYDKEVEDNTKWHIVSDSNKNVHTSTLDRKIGTGAIIIQTSKDGKIWVEAAQYTDIANNELDDVLYNTTNVQLADGCYYRIIVAYEIEAKTGTKKEWIGESDIITKKEIAEVYDFYAYDSTVDRTLQLNENDAYVFDEVYRTETFEGYSGAKEITNDDPHSGWKLGSFYVSGYTDERDIDGTPVFLKEAGDKATLWFHLNYDINHCNDKDSIRVTEDHAGSDQYFGTPTFDFGHGTLIVRKTGRNNQKDIEYYTNYLEASATPGANTRVELFEEGDYEVALDYQLHLDGTDLIVTEWNAKTLHYRIYFKFSVRNGDCKLFLRDSETKQFLDTANITDNGFYIDLAQSKYLSLLVTRDVMTDSLDGLVPDTKFNGAGKEGRLYTDEGIYTIKATNEYTGATTEKKVYVGDSDVLKAYMKTGLSISVINEKVAAGAYIEEDGTIVEPELETESETEVINENTEIQESVMDSSTVESEKTIQNKKDKINDKTMNPMAILVVCLVVCIGITVPIMKKNKKN